MKDKLIGDDAIVGRVLDKVELAARRVSAKSNDPSCHLIHSFAEEIMKIKADMYK